MHDAPQISPEHKQVTRDLVAELPKVVLYDELDLTGASTAEAVTRAAHAAAEELSADGVIYAELRVYPEQTELPPAETIDAAVTGFAQINGVDVRVIVAALRDQGRVEELARVGVEKFSDRVVGFALAGAEEPIAPHAEALRLLRENYVPTTIHAGASEGMDRITEAVDFGATRIAHGARIFDDFDASIEGITTGRVSSWVRDRGIALEICPSMEIELGVVDELADHPLTLLQQMGFTCTVNPGRRAVTGMTDELMRLVKTFDYGPDELFDVTATALSHAFCGKERRQELLATRLLPVYEELAGDVNEDTDPEE